MKSETGKMEELMLEEKTENLIAIGAATAANCIPCFEHLYEKAITSGITKEEVRRATDIASRVKAGAHVSLTSCVDELIGDQGTGDLPCEQMVNASCCHS